MHKRTFECTILDKRRKDGWFFGPSFYITLKITHGAESKTVERQVAVDQYYEVKIGQFLPLIMYSLNGRLWYFTYGEAALNP